MKRGTSTGDEKGITLALEIARLTGRIEAECERFERSRALPPGYVAGRVSELLGTPQIREGLGHSDFLRYMRMGERATAEAPEVNHATATVAAGAHPRRARVARGPRGPYKKKGAFAPKRSVNSRMQSEYWAKMTPEERAEEMQRRIAKRKANKKKEAATAKAAA